ncbi:hypothetical protein KGY73_06055 [bacterium]|nr:hypothetical protein [bacterium]
MSPVCPRSTHPSVGPFRCGRAGEHPVPPILFEKETDINNFDALLYSGIADYLKGDKENSFKKLKI